MWLIISARGESFLLKPKEVNIVGRKGGAVSLSDDQSISRQHAKLILDCDDSNSDCGITLIDLSSKYGTYVNDGIESSTRVAINEKIILKHDDLVRFGLQWNTWRIVFMPLIVTTSTLKQPSKQEVLENINKLGGKILSSWSLECSYLTSNQITLTIKVVSALGAGQYIVTPKYWKDLLSTIENKEGSIPEPSNYIPPLNEPTLNEKELSFQVNKQRSTLFKSLIFISSTPRQKSRIEPMITAAGGKVLFLEEANVKPEDFCKDNILLMQGSLLSSPKDADESQVSVSYNRYVRYLETNGLRCIPESDIGLSILYCSRETFCNPRYKMQNIFKSYPAPLQQTESHGIIVPETQDSSPIRQLPLTSKNVINETVLCDVSPDSEKNNKSSLTNNNDKEVKHHTNIQSSSIEDIDKKISTNKKLTNNILEKGTKENNDSVKSKNVFGGLNNDSFKLETRNNSKKRIVISDSDNSDNEFNLPSQKKKICLDNKKSNVQNKLFDVRDEDIKEVSIVIDSDDDVANRLSLQSEKIGNSVVMDSESDMFDNDNKSVSNKSKKPPTSVDMFASIGCSSNYKQKTIQSRGSSIASGSRKSYDIFQSFNSRSMKNDAEEIDENDFEFNISKSSKTLPKETKDNVFPSCSNNPFQTNRLSTDSFDASSTLSSKTRAKRNIKHSISIDEPPHKKSAFDNIDSDSDDGSDSKPLKVTPFKPIERPLSIIPPEEIKQEPVDFTIQDEELLNSTKVVVKSLIAPLKSISITHDGQGSSTRLNFKKFKKATPITKDLNRFCFNLVPFKEHNESGGWMNDTDINPSDESSDDEVGWSFKQSQNMKLQNKKQKKAK